MTEKLWDPELDDEPEGEEAEPCPLCGLCGEHEEDCLPCPGGTTGECSRRYWKGDYGCSSHAAYNYAEDQADRQGYRI